MPMPRQSHLHVDIIAYKCS